MSKREAKLERPSGWRFADVRPWPVVIAFALGASAAWAATHPTNGIKVFQTPTGQIGLTATATMGCGFSPYETTAVVNGLSIAVETTAGNLGCPPGGSPPSQFSETVYVAAGADGVHDVSWLFGTGPWPVPRLLETRFMISHGQLVVESPIPVGGNGAMVSLLLLVGLIASMRGRRVAS